MKTRLSVMCAAVLVATVLNPGSRAATPQSGSNTPKAQTSQQQAGGRQSGDPRSGTSQRTRLPWWKDPAVVKELNLKPEQADQIDKLWHDRSKEMSGRWEEQKKQQTELTRMLEERRVSPDVIALQVDRVEAQRTMLEKSRTVMLYRMSLVLTPEQNKALQAIFERNRRNDGRR